MAAGLCKKTLKVTKELQLPSMDEKFTLERSAPKKIIVPVLLSSLGSQGSQVCLHACAGSCMYDKVES